MRRCGLPADLAVALEFADAGVEDLLAEVVGWARTAEGVEGLAGRPPFEDVDAVGFGEVGADREVQAVRGGPGLGHHLPTRPQIPLALCRGDPQMSGDDDHVGSVRSGSILRYRLRAVREVIADEVVGTSSSPLRRPRSPVSTPHR